jgi:hypothetical protein
MADLVGSFDKATELGIIDVSWTVASDCESHGSYDTSTGRGNTPPTPPNTPSQQTVLPPVAVCSKLISTDVLTQL